MQVESNKRPWLQNSLRFTPGPIADRVAANVHLAERAARGLWRRKASTWSGAALLSRIDL
jgi:hypothetical protein